MARFVHHVTVDDGAELQPGAKFSKVWRIRNDSGRCWPGVVEIVPVSKHRLGADHFNSPDAVQVQRALKPGQEMDLQLDLCAPSQPGQYQGFWRLRNGRGQKFGQRLWVRIIVKDASSSNSNAEDHGERKLDDEAKTELGGDEANTRHAGDSPAACAAESQMNPKNVEPASQFIYQTELLFLCEAGFTNEARNKKLLLKFKGNVERVVRKLKKHN